MKCQIIIDENCEERVVIYSKKSSPLLEEIKSFAEGISTEIKGYFENEIQILNPSEIYCFSIIDNRLFALCCEKKFALKERLYQIEKILPNSFLKINQSCIVNIRKIKKFDTSISGALKVVLKNGYTDFVSRRQLKQIKERLGL